MAYTTIDKHTDYFNTKLHTGNGSTQSITGVGFQPSLTWIKDRSGGNDHQIVDAVRGATYAISSNRNDALTFTDGLTSFDSDGYTLGLNTRYNGSSTNYVGWNWLGNGSTTVSNTNGTITSNVSYNSTADFSIITYTGTGQNDSIGHGLSGTPDWFFVRASASTSDWHVWCNNFPSQKRIKLNSTAGWNTNASIFASLPDSTKINLGYGGDVNGSGVDYICYAWKNVTGFSKAGSYIGNSGNNADAPFVYTGFKPKFLIIRNVSQTSAWQTYDAERLGYNDKNYELRPNESAAEGATTDYVDLLSNGFKLRHQSTGVNQNGDEFIYLAFGQSLVGSNNVPCTAR